MRKLILSCAMFCAMVPAISASPVQAQKILWVSASGNDGNVCSQTSPCLTFQGAINKGGVDQINCLTSGSYGAFTITASITVDCGAGNIGNVVVSSGNAITINTASAATIVLRHLSLNGPGGSSSGISTQSFYSGTLIVEDCMIHGFGNSFGVYFAPSGGRGLLQVSNTRVSGNLYGIGVEPASGKIASAVFNRAELVANSLVGLRLGGSGIIAGTMRHSVAGANGTGIYAGATQVYFTVEESSIVANTGIGIETDSGGVVINVGGSTIGGNGTGVRAYFGSIISFGNNQMSANGSNGSFTSTTPLK